MDKCKSSLRGSIVDADYTDKQWEEEWEKLKQNGSYEVDFGDFFLYGKCTKTIDWLPKPQLNLNLSGEW